MIDHLDIHVQDLSRAKNFYTAVLASLGGHLIDESNSGLTYQTGENADGYIWFEIGEPYPFHFAFQAKTNSEVDEFYKKSTGKWWKRQWSTGLSARQLLRSIYN